MTYSLKCLLGLLFILLNITNVKSQDIITTTEGDDILAKVIEVGVTEIRYKRRDSLEGPVYVILKSNVVMIRYDNGEKDIFLEKTAPNTGAEYYTDENVLDPTVSPHVRGYEDATKYYHGHVAAGTGTLVVSLLIPVVGLIPAIACSSTKPKEKNLGYPSYSMYKNQDYANGYRISAKKKKQKKVWTNWGIAFGVNLILIAALSGG